VGRGRFLGQLSDLHQAYRSGTSDYYLVWATALGKQAQAVRSARGFCDRRRLFGRRLDFSLAKTRLCPIVHVRDRKAPVAQLDRATVYGTVGWRFEPVRVHASD
jgi:hypothetical protein